MTSMLGRTRRLVGVGFGCRRRQGPGMRLRRDSDVGPYQVLYFRLCSVSFRVSTLESMRGRPGRGRGDPGESRRGRSALVTDQCYGLFTTQTFHLFQTSESTKSTPTGK